MNRPLTRDHGGLMYTIVPSPLMCYTNGERIGGTPPMNPSGSGRNRTRVPRLWLVLGDAR